MEEVRVLRFFEDGPIDKVEAVFNIVSEKMRERLRGRTAPEGATASKRRGRKAVSETIDESLSRSNEPH
jgi:hypothetical protein